MQRHFWKSLTFLTIFGSLLFAACTQQEAQLAEVTSETAKQTLSEEDLAEIPYTEAALLLQPVLQPPTVDQEMAIIQDGVPEEIESKHFHFFDSSGTRYSIWACLDSTNLSIAQKDSLRLATRRFQLCKRLVIHDIRTINRTILASANQERKLLVKAYRSGRITLVQLQQKLLQLVRKTRHALRTHPVKLRHLAQLRHCYHRYLRALHRVLTPAQWQTFIQCFKQIRPR